MQSIAEDDPSSSNSTQNSTILKALFQKINQRYTSIKKIHLEMAELLNAQLVQKKVKSHSEF